MKTKMQIPETILNALTGKIAVALVSAASTLAVSILTWATEPVKEVLEVPNRLDKVEQAIYELSETTKGIDSTLRLSVYDLAQQIAGTDANIQVLDIQMDAVGDEFPTLYKRFDDIERSVTSINRIRTYAPSIGVEKIY